MTQVQTATWLIFVNALKGRANNVSSKVITFDRNIDLYVLLFVYVMSQFQMSCLFITALESFFGINTVAYVVLTTLHALHKKKCRSLCPLKKKKIKKLYRTYKKRIKLKKIKKTEEPSSKSIEAWQLSQMHFIVCIIIQLILIKLNRISVMC